LALGFWTAGLGEASNFSGTFAPAFGTALVFAAVGLSVFGKDLGLSASGEASRDLFLSAGLGLLWLLLGNGATGSTGRQPGKVPRWRMASNKPPGRAGACAKLSSGTAAAAADN